MFPGTCENAALNPFGFQASKQEGRQFVALPLVPGCLLADGFGRAVLDFLVKNEALSEELRSRMLAWRHGGFSAHNEVRVVAEDAEGRKKLAGYMLRAPMSLQKMTYDAVPDIA